METVGYCVRVQALDGYATKIVTLSLQYDAIIAVKHKGKKGDNPHYHIVVRTTVKPQAFRVRMKVIFNEGKGNEHMSIRNWDGKNQAMSYLFHEDRDATPLCKRGITDEFLQTLRMMNDDVQVEVKKAKEKAANGLWEPAYNHFKDDGSRYLDDAEIGQFIILTALRGDKYMPQPWLLKAMVIKVKFKILEGSVAAEENYARQLAANIFRT